MRLRPTRTQHSHLMRREDLPSAFAIRRDKTRDLWIIELVACHDMNLPFILRHHLDPIWSPHGTRIAFSSSHMGQRDLSRDLYQMPADGSGSAELLLGGKGAQTDVEDGSRRTASILCMTRLLQYRFLPRSISMRCLLPATGSPCYL